jgi:serine-type D-Ala-D-Ala carboxypeptidase/endopeptidase (penicillin-binding protein 4)
MRIILIALVSMTCLTKSIAQNPEFVNKLLSQECFENASFTIYAIDLGTNETLISYDIKRSLAPASVQKLFSTAAALELYNNDYRFKTELAYSGKIDYNGVLTGDIYIIGYGDPTLGSSHFNNHYSNYLQNWVSFIKSAGIKEIKGNIIGDPSEFCYPEINDKWFWEDIANHYASPACGLCINDNIYSLYFKTGNTEGSSTEVLRMEPVIKGYNFTNYVTSASSGGDQAYIFGGPESTNRVIKGTLPWNNQSFKIKGIIADPPLFAAEMLKQEIEKLGINVTGIAQTKPKANERPAVKILNTLYSPELKDIVTLTNMWSVNLYAEHLGILCSLFLKNDVNHAASALEGFWESKGMNTKGLILEDACGLSHYNTINSEQLIFLLKYMYKSKNFEDFKSTLPVIGESGTLQWYCRKGSAKAKVWVKGGSMKRVRSFAGYAKTNSEKTIAFAIIINNYTCKDYYIKSNLENFFNDMVENL